MSNAAHNQHLTTDMDFKKGDLVLVQLWGEDEHTPLLNEFAAEIARLGAKAIKQQHSMVYYKDQFQKLSNRDNPFPDSYFNQFKPVKAVVNLIAYSPDALHPDFPADKVDVYQNFIASLDKALEGRPVYDLPVSEF